MTDPYSYWQAKLDGLDPDPPADRTEMPCGFWRLRDSQPLAVWKEDDRHYALVGFATKQRMMRPGEMERIAEMGGFGQAVTEVDYRQAHQVGYWEKDEPPPIEAPPRPGSNLPEDPFEQIRLELDSEIENASPFLKKAITDQATADKLAAWSRRIGQLKARADLEFETEKAPTLKAAKAVDDKWRGVRTEAQSLTTRLKEHVGIWLRKLKREAEERERQAREEARLLREQAEAERSPVEAQELLDEATVIEAQAEPPRIIAGRPSMRVSLRTVRTAKITDYHQAFLAFENHPDMRALVQTLADRAVKAGVTVAGVEVEETQKPV